GLNRGQVQRIGDGLLVGIRRGAGGLGGPVDALQGRPDRAGFDQAAHQLSRVVRSRRTATRVLAAIGTLNALCASGRAGASSASAAARNTSWVAGAPRSSSSARVARQG